MKKLLIIFLLPLCAKAQKLPDFGVSKIRIVGTDKTILAEIYPVPNISTKSDKLYYWYGSNLIHTTQGGFSGRLLNGLYTEYYLNKNLKEQGLFKKGLKDGPWKSWNEGGVLLQVIDWQKGVLSGKFEIYSDNGKLKQTGYYDNNLQQGKSQFYSGPDSGKIAYYDHGNIAGDGPTSFWKRLPLINKKAKQPETTMKQLP